MSEADKRNEYAERLKDLAMSMYQAMSQGGDNRIAVGPLQAEDVCAASMLVRSGVQIWNEAIEHIIPFATAEYHITAQELRRHKKMTDDNLNDTQQKLYTSTLQEHDKAVWNEAIEAAIAKCISLSEQHDWSPGYQRAAKVVSDKIRQLKK